MYPLRRQLKFSPIGKPETNVARRPPSPVAVSNLNNPPGIKCFPVDIDWLLNCLQRGETERFNVDIWLTPEIAAVMLEFNVFNRPVVQARVAEWRDIIAKGDMEWCSQGICFSSENRLINGQHRLLAIRDSTATVAMNVWFGLPATQFRIIDVGGGRTAADMLAIANHPNAYLRASVIGHVIRLERRENSNPSKKDIEVRSTELIGTVFDEAVTCGQRLKAVVRPTSGALAYYYIVTKTAHLDRLPEFWDCLVTGANLDKGNPVLKLREALRSGTLLNQYAGGHTRVIKGAAAIIQTWNAWCEGRRRVDLNWDKVVSLPDAI